MQLETLSTRRQRRVWRKLYKQAFPRQERKPFSLMRRRSRTRDMELLSILGDDGAFLGLAAVALHEDLALLAYFAVSACARGKGVGSEALALLKARYQSRRLFLEIERTGVPAQNAEQRVRRKAFYLRAGFSPCPFLVSLFGVEMEVLCFGKPVSFAEYRSVYARFSGGRADRFVRLLPPPKNTTPPHPDL